MVCSHYKRITISARVETTVLCSKSAIVTANLIIQFYIYTQNFVQYENNVAMFDLQFILTLQSIFITFFRCFIS